MVKSEATSDKEVLWLKRLHGSLDDDDDSSDSASQRSHMTREKVVRKKATIEKEGGGQTRVKKRLRQLEDNNSEGEIVEGRDTIKEIVRRRVKKPGKAETSTRCKVAVVEAVKDEGERRKQKLPTRRSTLGKNDKTMAKSARREVLETPQKKERATGKEDAKGYQETKVDVEVKSERRIRSSPRSVVRKKSSEKSARKRTVPKTATFVKMEHERNCTDPCMVSTTNNGQEHEKAHEVQVEVTIATSMTERFNVNGNNEDVMTIPELHESKVHDKETFAVVKTEPIQVRKPGGHEGTKRVCIDVVKTERGEGRAQVDMTTDMKKVANFEKREVTSGALNVRPCGGLEHSHAQEVLKAEPMADVDTRLKQENSDERQTEASVASLSADHVVKKEVKSEEKCSDGKAMELMLETMPIPRKKTRNEQLTAVPAVKSFVIPKRSFGNDDKAGQTTKGPVTRPRSGEYQVKTEKSAMNSSTFVVTPLLPSPPSSPKVINPIRAVTKRSKTPVPVQMTPISIQDRALMRLSKKRNSIFMAAMELAYEARSNKKQMMGYEVYDGKGKALPDLIPRLTCATKREVTSKHESDAVSFFGVSLSVPTTQQEVIAAVEECGTNDVNSRKISCYKELRFNRLEDREFYQRKMYGTTFIPQRLRGWITLMVRNARFERKSTGIRFNQDRDREEFAASLSKRYTLNNSVPRCDIPRENWQKLMRNQPGSLYLHYYNREDAERAAQIFRDDLGQPLELRLSLKAGVLIRTSSLSGLGPRPQHVPGRSHSSERSVPESSPSSLQNGNVWTSSSWRREHQPISKCNNRYARHDRNAPVPWSRGDRRYGTFDVGNKRSRALGERRSRSRSRSKSFRNWQNDPESRSIQERAGRHTPPPLVNDVRERIGNGNSSNAGPTDVDKTPARKRDRSLPRSPRRSPLLGPDRSMRERESGEAPGGWEDGEIFNRPGIEGGRTMSGSDERSALHRAKSPLRRWPQEPSSTGTGQRPENFANYPRDRSWDRPHRDMEKRRSRSRSRSRPPLLGHGGNHSEDYKERRGFRDFDRMGAYDPPSRERRVPFNRGHGGYRGGSSSR